MNRKSSNIVNEYEIYLPSSSKNVQYENVEKKNRKIKTFFRSHHHHQLENFTVGIFYPFKVSSKRIYNINYVVCSACEFEEDILPMGNVSFSWKFILACNNLYNRFVLYHLYTWDAEWNDVYSTWKKNFTSCWCIV